MADQTSVSAAELEQTLFVENTNLVIWGIVAIYDWHGKSPIKKKVLNAWVRLAFGRAILLSKCHNSFPLLNLWLFGSSKFESICQRSSFLAKEEAQLFVQFGLMQGCATCCSLGLWSGHGERMRKWSEIHSLHFLIFSSFPPSLYISYIQICHILLQNAKYGTFVRNVTKT